LATDYAVLAKINQQIEVQEEFFLKNSEKSKKHFRDKPKEML